MRDYGGLIVFVFVVLAMFFILSFNEYKRQTNMTEFQYCSTQRYSKVYFDNSSNKTVCIDYRGEKFYE